METSCVITTSLLAKIDKECKKLFDVYVAELTEAVVKRNLNKLKERIIYSRYPKTLNFKKHAEANTYYQKFKRALKEKPEKMTRSFDAWDFVCYVFLRKSVTKCCKNYDPNEIIIKLMPQGKAKGTKRKKVTDKTANGEVQSEIGDSAPNDRVAAIHQSKAIIDSESYHGFLLTTTEYWKRIRRKVSGKDQMLRYYTHLASNMIPEAVAQDDFIVEPRHFFESSDVDASTESVPIPEVFERAFAESLSLIKILGEGGIGKSTFLFWIARHYCTSAHVVIIERFFKDTIDEILKKIKPFVTSHQKPLLFVIDDASQPDRLDHFDEFIGKIRQGVGHLVSITVVLCDRDSRFNSKIGRGFDKYFIGSIQKINYTPPSKEKVFDHLFSALIVMNPRLNEELIRQSSRNVFLHPGITSISGSTYSLLRFLTINHDLDYMFDWEDWENFIKSKLEFRRLDRLFLAVATFNQFGILLPVELPISSLKEANTLDIKAAISAYGRDQTPILIISPQDPLKAPLLRLRHDHIATWFFHEDKQRELAGEVMREFLTSIDNEKSADVLRQFRKLLRSKEYMNSGLSKYLNEDRYVQLAHSYSNLPSVSKDDSEKMRMEEAMVFLVKKEDEKAIQIFESIAKKNRLNNHSRDQLGRIYMKNPATYSKAIQMYWEIFENNESYPLVLLYKLVKLCAAKGVTISDMGRHTFDEAMILAKADQLSDYFKHMMIKYAIEYSDFDLAEDVLMRVKEPNSFTAECFNALAKAIPHNGKEIQRKIRLYQKAIYFGNRLHVPGLIQYKLEYAVFLYRTDYLKESYEEKESLLASLRGNYLKYIRAKYRESVRRTTKLFFADLPYERDLQIRKLYLMEKCNVAAGEIDKTQSNIDSIIHGYLILRTVQVHSKAILPDVFLHASKLLAYCHAWHAKKKWNTLSEQENLRLSDELYDRLIRLKYRLTTDDWLNIIHCLLNLGDENKTQEALSHIYRLMDKEKNEKLSIIYRYRGIAKKMLGKYESAMKDLLLSERLCNPNIFIDRRSFIDEHTLVSYNIATLICECIEDGRPISGYNLKFAEKNIDYALKLRPGRKGFKMMKERIAQLMDK